jgi:hypothetical protein
MDRSVLFQAAERSGLWGDDLSDVFGLILYHNIGCLLGVGLQYHDS